MHGIVDSSKLEYGPGTIYASFPSFLEMSTVSSLEPQSPNRESPDDRGLGPQIAKVGPVYITSAPSR